MEKNKEKDNFHYTYSASEQEELKTILQKYQPKEETKMEQLRRLDASAEKKAMSASIAVGIIGALLLGTGMSFSTTDFAIKLGFMPGMNMTVGIVIGIVGLLIMGLAYPIYKRVVKKEREKIASRVFELTEELMK